MAFRRIPLSCLLVVALLLSAVGPVAGAQAASASSGVSAHAAKAKHRQKHRRRKHRRKKHRRHTSSASAGSSSSSNASGAGATPPSVIQNCGAGANVVPSAATTATATAAIFCLVNNERVKAGIVPLRDERHLDSAAVGHSVDMVVHQYFAHNGPDGDPLSRVQASGYFSGVSGAWSIGENIAWGSGGYGTPASIVQAWMNSPGHRAHILDGQLRDVGTGVAAGAPQPVGGMPAAVYTQDFGGHS